MIGRFIAARSERELPSACSEADGPVGFVWRGLSGATIFAALPTGTHDGWIG